MITDIQRFSLNDGPGIRTTVFFKGCGLACKWCHNPETFSMKPQLLVYPEKCAGCGHCVAVCPTGARYIKDGKLVYEREKCTGCGACAYECFYGALQISGQDLTADDVMFQVEQDIPYYKHSNGGVTLSGGEAMLQKKLCQEIITACKERGIQVAVETALNIPAETVEEIAPQFDLIMFDIKLPDSESYKEWTGVGNELIVKNIEFISKLGIPLIVRTPIIPGVNDSTETIRKIADYIAKLENVSYYELLNYNPLGHGKYAALGMECPFEEARPLSKERMEELRAAAAETGLTVKVG